MNRLTQSLWRHAAAVAALALFAIVAILYFFTSWLGSDLGGNLFAEAFGIFFTVALIEGLIRANSRRQTRTSRFAAYLEANRVLTYICGTWSEIVKSSVSAPPEIGSDLFSRPFLLEVASHFDLTSVHQGILPEQTWRAYIAQMPKNVRDAVDKIVSRYQLYIDPELLSVLLKVEKLPFIMIWGQLDVIVQFGGHSPGVLPFPDDMLSEFEVLRTLHRILTAQAAEFRRLDGFVEPFDLTFRSAIQLMHDLGDLGPAIGSSRR